MSERKPTGLPSESKSILEQGQKLGLSGNALRIFMSVVAAPNHIINVGIVRSLFPEIRARDMNVYIHRIRTQLNNSGEFGFYTFRGSNFHYTDGLIPENLIFSSSTIRTIIDRKYLIAPPTGDPKELGARAYSITRPVEREVPLELRDHFRTAMSSVNYEHYPYSLVHSLPGMQRMLFFYLSAVGHEYIAGNVKMAHDIRLEAIRIIKANPTRYWESIGLKFDAFFKDWPISASKRKGRFDFHMDQRANQTRSPEKWQQAFLNALQILQIPDFDTYRSALEYSRGALQTRTAFRAQGIK